MGLVLKVLGRLRVVGLVFVDLVCRLWGRGEGGGRLFGRGRSVRKRIFLYRFICFFGYLAISPPVTGLFFKLSLSRSLGIALIAHFPSFILLLLLIFSYLYLHSCHCPSRLRHSSQSLFYLPSVPNWQFTIALILTITMGVKLLWSVGNEEMGGVLGSGVAPIKKH
jgi:hypothetical protein